ncbi:MAG: hypothetical protein OXG82_21930 [Gammaproteobacteria bacterium]|nr:hypothetical protein [Gammaproteobacteria bacterium]
MKRNPDAKGKAVELLNVPLYSQGTFDGLCVYYTGAMMLATLFPEYASEFGRANPKAVRLMSYDPLIREYPERGQQDHRRTLARWFYHGESIATVVDIINQNVRRPGLSTYFEFVELDRREQTFDNEIVGNIEVGLPVMLGWNTKDYGSHAVLVTGYWIGKEKWLTVNDPSGDTNVSWNSLKAQQEGMGKFEVGFCREHRGPRPMKSIQTSGSAPVVYQWMPLRLRPRPPPSAGSDNGGFYLPVTDLF